MLRIQILDLTIAVQNLISFQSNLVLSVHGFCRPNISASCAVFAATIAKYGKASRYILNSTAAVARRCAR
jgi:hypothetical protein